MADHASEAHRKPRDPEMARDSLGVTPVTAMLARATSRKDVDPADGKSTSVFERVIIDGDIFFLKRLSPASDWIMRATGDHVHRPYRIWQAGIMDRIPTVIDHAVVAMEISGVGEDAELSILMRDVTAGLVPEGDSSVRAAQHRGFIDHLAQLSAAFWGWTDSVGGLTTMPDRIRFFDAANVERELAVKQPPSPIVAADTGWRLLFERSPAMAFLARAVQIDPEIITGRLAATPVTLLHGDWKMGNLGTHPDGRTILIDWAYPGSGPACWDLCWYLALNQARIPESKEATIARFHIALERHGVDCAGWFETQLDLCMIGIMAAFGWEKALGDDDELHWWDCRVADAVNRQRLDVLRLTG